MDDTLARARAVLTGPQYVRFEYGERLAFIALGLYALVRRRPFLIDARWLLVLVVGALSPNFATSLDPLFAAEGHGSGRLDLVFALSLAAMLVMVGLMALQMRGYMVYATTPEPFREALMAALAALDLKGEETLSTIRLPSVPAELPVAVCGWLGSGQLRLRGGGRGCSPTAPPAWTRTSTRVGCRPTCSRRRCS